MQKIAVFLTGLLWVALGLRTAEAQPTCSASVPGSVVCQSQATNLQLTDILSGTQATGPLRANQSVKVSLSQVLNRAGSSQYFPFTGGGLTGKLTTAVSGTGSAGFNLAPGTAPAAPVNGDEWTTSAGLFVQAGGITFGPLGAGGGVNTGTLNALAYYAGAGNTLSGLATTANRVLITSGTGVMSFSATLPTGMAAPLAILQPANYANSAALPAVTTANTGQFGYVVNCLNGSETGTGGSGCMYTVNAVGSWIPLPSLPTQQLTVGGQALYLGQSTINEGIGGKLLTFSGSFVSGHAVSLDANGTAIDAGVVPGGGSGGNGTVTAGTINQMAWYSASGTAVAGLASVNNAVLGTSGAGVPSMLTTLPSGLTLPSPTISNPVLTGAGTYVGLTGTGKLVSAAATTTQAGLNVLPGVVPTAPVNGDIWSTNTGFFIRYNGGTFPVGAGNGTLTGATTALPLTGGGTTGTLALGCATCVTSAAGGPLVAAAPLLFNAATSTVSMGSQTKTFTFNADPFTTVGNAAYTLYLTFPYATGAITNVQATTGGTSTPSFIESVQVNGVSVATCSNLTVSPTTPVNATCGANSIAAGNPVTLLLSGTSGSPSSTVIQVTYTASAS
jgi:hypothetical protein